MGRYDQTKLNKKNKKNYYSTTIYEKVPERNDDMYFISQEGDRCDNLAVRYYGNPNLWWYIARVNDLKTNNIPAGISLRIPLSPEKAQGS